MKTDPDFDRKLAAARKRARRPKPPSTSRTEAEYKQKQATLDEASNRRDAAAKALNDTMATTAKNAKRLQKFVDLVTANKIRPFTKYAADNWPKNPEEFFAEAYSLWLTDPTFLRTNYKVVHDYFDSGDYLT